MKKTAVILALIVAAAPAFARSFTSEQRAACTADHQKFCANASPGGGRIVKCLKDHTDQLGEKCRAAIAEAAARRDAMRDDCAADHQKFCASVEPGGGAIKKCLQQHADRLSAACRGAMPQTGTDGK